MSARSCRAASNLLLSLCDHNGPTLFRRRSAALMLMAPSATKRKSSWHSFDAPPSMRTEHTSPICSNYEGLDRRKNFWIPKTAQPHHRNYANFACPITKHTRQQPHHNPSLAQITQNENTTSQNATPPAPNGNSNSPPNNLPSVKAQTCKNVIHAPSPLVNGALDKHPHSLNGSGTHAHPELPRESFFRRELPPHCISFSSSEGKQLFKEALEEGFMESYFTLAAQYRTQSEPAFCGLGTLTMVLNALDIDPGRIWKGPWRWFSEEMLDCCTPLEVVQKQGITLGQFVCLARCNGAAASLYYGSDSTEEDFRREVMASSRTSEGVTIASYNRAKVGQTGSGHFSPIGGYHPKRDLVLIMEVARFKYPPHWLPLSMLFEATKDKDAMTGLSRGYVTLSAARQFCFWCNNKV